MCNMSVYNTEIVSLGRGRVLGHFCKVTSLQCPSQFSLQVDARGSFIKCILIYWIQIIFARGDRLKVKFMAPTKPLSIWNSKMAPSGLWKESEIKLKYPEIISPAIFHVTQSYCCNQKLEFDRPCHLRLCNSRTERVRLTQSHNTTARTHYSSD